MNKVISFLGTSKYEEAYYVFKGEKSKQKYQFIQEALVEFFCKDWKDDDEFVIFMTEKAKKKNWLGKNESQEANFEIGLKEKLLEIKKRLNKNFKIIEVIIPEGEKEEELWEIFGKIYENTEENDSIIFDVTHSFRTIPMVTLIILNYLKFIKNIEITRIVYGQMHSLSNNENEKSIQILDFTTMWNLMEWTIAVERFLQTGNANKIKELTEGELLPYLKNTPEHLGSKVRNLINSLYYFTQNVSTSREGKFKGNIEKIKNLLPEAKKELKKLKPLGPRLEPLLDKVYDRFSTMNCNDEISCGLEVSKWCLDNGYIQQGITILRETIVNYVIINILNNNELNKPEYREIGEIMLNFRDENLPKDLLDLWKEIGDYRNDINHAGWRENPHDSQDFHSKLKEFIEKFTSIINNR